MISRKTFDLVRSRYPLHASWAIWAAEGRTPKSNISDLSVLDPGANPELLDTLHTRFVLVGLNVASRPIAAPLANFHDASPRATDFRIRAALLGTACWGAYMTDVIKDFPETCSGKMTAYLRSDPKFELAQIESFRIELDAVRSGALRNASFAHTSGTGIASSAYLTTRSTWVPLVIANAFTKHSQTRDSSACSPSSRPLM
jgi:hypothetical protein